MPNHNEDLLFDENGNLVEDSGNREDDHEDDDLEEDEGREPSHSHQGSQAPEENLPESNDEDPSEDPDEREAIRQRRREERKHRKEAQREREDNLRRELAARDAVINELRARQDAIERRNTGSELAQLENAKRETAQAYNYFKDQIRVATEAGNGAAVAEATEKMLQTQRRFDEIQNYERAYKQNQNTPQPLDPRLVNHAKQWMDSNKWYDPSARDQDSRIVMSLDQQLAEAGWDPTTPAYWEELSERVKKYLPHRVKSGNIRNVKARSVVPSSGREGRSAPTSQGTFRLSSERVQALKDAGIWDDPKSRADAIKRFREFDKQNRDK